MTSVEQILGLRCMYKERQPLDKCRECTGYRCYAKEIQCENYLPYSRQTKPHQFTSEIMSDGRRTSITSQEDEERTIGLGKDKPADRKLNKGIDKGYYGD